MGQHFSLGMLELQLQQRLLAKGFVHDAASGPEGEFPAALGLHPAPQVLVWAEQDRPISGQLLHQGDRIAAGANQIALGLHGGGAIDVAHGDVVGVVGPEGGKGIGRTGIGQAATGLQIGDQHRFGGAEDLGRFGHEVDPAKHDHLSVGAGGLTGELKGITDEISDVLNGSLLVVVGQDHGLALPLELCDGRGEFGGRGTAPGWARTG